MGFTCNLKTNTFPAGRYWGFKFNFIESGLCDQNYRQSSGKLRSRSDCTFVQSCLDVHSPKNACTVAKGGKGIQMMEILKHLTVNKYK